MHLLPYALADDEIEGATTRWDASQTQLELDQRQEWWRNYRAVTGLPHARIPSELLDGDLGDITRQPLLMYLVALSFARGKLKLDDYTNLNDVYADLIDAVWERAYERRQFAGIRELTSKMFRRVLEDIGLTAWHDESRTTTVQAIQRRFESAGLTKQLHEFQQGAELGVTRLLAAFYFRQHGARGDQRTFEFTHKSFGEYLAACRIVRTIAALERDIAEHENDPDRGKDITTALADFADVCGPSQLDEYFTHFLDREIERAGRGNPELVRRWHDRLTELLNAAAVSGMPIERMKRRPSTFRDEMRYSRNAEEALFACAAACADVTHRHTSIRWPTPTTAGEWIRRLQGQRAGNRSAIILSSLRWLDLSKCSLQCIDLAFADLSNARLENALAECGCFLGARLHKAKCSGAKFTRSNFVQAKLDEATMDEANLESAALDKANLERASFRRAMLTHVRATGAEAACADLYHADLEGADLSRAALQSAHLEGANLSGANLTGARLEDAVLDSANINAACFEGAHYDEDTRFPSAWFNPAEHAMQKESTSRMVQQATADVLVEDEDVRVDEDTGTDEGFVDEWGDDQPF